MGIEKIELTEQEKQLLQGISFDDIDKQSCKNAGDLALLLIKRNAIPNIRQKYFSDEKYNIGGRGKSREDIFQKNGTKGIDIFYHPHFLKYVKYFIFGPDLPKSVIQEICNNHDSNDYSLLARDIVRKQHLNPKKAAEEFYKLFIECDDISIYAESVRKSVMSVKL